MEMTLLTMKTRLIVSLKTSLSNVLKYRQLNFNFSICEKAEMLKTLTAQFHLLYYSDEILKLVL